MRREFRSALESQLRRTAYSVIDQRAFPRLSGETRISAAGMLPKIIHEYPGLERIWKTQLRGWEQFVLAFARHATTFLQEHALKQGRHAIVHLRCGLSDLHDGGRSVVSVRFSEAGTWYDKPRTGRRDVAWFRLLRMLNDLGFFPRFAIPQIFLGRNHHWIREVKRRGCRTIEEQHRFYRRIGAILYLANIFRAVDLHAANFVVHGEHPVLIDCETLFHPETEMALSAHIDEHSLFRTGMISAVKGGNAHPLVDFSHQRPVVRRLIRVCPDQADFREILTGFHEMHKLWRCCHNNARVRDATDGMLKVPTRYIYRPTVVYNHVLDEALSAIYLRSSVGIRPILRQRLEGGP